MTASHQSKILIIWSLGVTGFRWPSSYRIPSSTQSGILPPKLNTQSLEIDTNNQIWLLTERSFQSVGSFFWLYLKCLIDRLIGLTNVSCVVIPTQQNHQPTFKACTDGSSSQRTWHEASRPRALWPSPDTDCPKTNCETTNDLVSRVSQARSVDDLRARISISFSWDVELINASTQQGISFCRTPESKWIVTLPVPAWTGHPSWLEPPWNSTVSCPLTGKVYNTPVESHKTCKQSSNTILISTTVLVTFPNAQMGIQCHLLLKNY